MKWREEWPDDEVPSFEKIVRQKPRRDDEEREVPKNKHRREKEYD